MGEKGEVGLSSAEQLIKNIENDLLEVIIYAQSIFCFNSVYSKYHFALWDKISVIFECFLWPTSLPTSVHQFQLDAEEFNLPKVQLPSLESILNEVRV